MSKRVYERYYWSVVDKVKSWKKYGEGFADTEEEAISEAKNAASGITNAWAQIQGFDLNPVTTIDLDDEVEEE